MLASERAGGAPSAGHVLELLCLLWLAGMAMQVAVLAVPPVIPLIRDELGMSETKVGVADRAPDRRLGVCRRSRLAAHCAPGCDLHAHRRAHRHRAGRRRPHRRAGCLAAPISPPC